MKTLFHILVILFIAAIVAAVAYGLVENTSTTSSSVPNGGQPPAMNANGEMPARPEGGEHGASLAGGLSGVLTLLAKIAGITLIVTLIEKVFNRPRQVPAS